MSHSLGVVAVSADGSSYVNDLVIRRNVSIPARDVRTYLHATHGGGNDKLEVYLTQGESAAPLDCTILGKYVFRGIAATDAEVAIDVGLSYDADGVVQVSATQRDSGHRLAMEVEPVPDDLSWLAGPPAAAAGPEGGKIRVMLLVDCSSSMMGDPLAEAQDAARAFLDRCDFTTTEVGLISFATVVALQAAPTSNVRRVHAAIHRLEAEGSTNLSDALELARGELVADDARRYIVLLTDGYPDAAESAVEQAEAARAQGIEVVAIGTGAADRAYLARLASGEAASIFVRGGELVRAFGHIARVIAEGGRSIRILNP
jgi:Mg-chelatase subunit ChlD